MASLNDITDAFGKWIASTHANEGYVFNWSVSTDFGPHKEILNQLGVKEAQVLHSVATFLPYEPDVRDWMLVDVDYIENRLDRPTEPQTLTVSYEDEESFTWSLTESINVGVKVTTEVGVPLLAKGSAELSVSLDLSSTQSWTKVTRTTLTESRTMVVNSNKVGILEFYVARSHFSPAFIVETVVSGVAVFGFSLPDDVTFLGLFGLEYIVAKCKELNLIDTTGYVPSYGNRIIVTASGHLKGNQATYTRTIIHEHDSVPENASDHADKPRIRLSGGLMQPAFASF